MPITKFWADNDLLEFVPLPYLGLLSSYLGAFFSSCSSCIAVCYGCIALIWNKKLGECFSGWCFVMRSAHYIPNVQTTNLPSKSFQLDCLQTYQYMGTYTVFSESPARAANLIGAPNFHMLLWRNGPKLFLERIESFGENCRLGITEVVPDRKFLRWLLNNHCKLLLDDLVRKSD